MTSEEKRAVKAAVELLESLGYKSGDIHDDLLATIQDDSKTTMSPWKWKVKSRTVRGLYSRYREFIVVKTGSETVLGPFSKKQEALKQAEYMNGKEGRQ